MRFELEHMSYNNPYYIGKSYKKSLKLGIFSHLELPKSQTKLFCIEVLKAINFGCLVIQIVIACLFYADDIAPLLPFRYGLQQLLNICSAYCKQFCLDFNVKKSKVMVICKSFSDIKLAPLLLDNQPLEFVSQYKYLVLFSNFYHTIIS